MEFICTIHLFSTVNVYTYFANVSSVHGQINPDKRPMFEKPHGCPDIGPKRGHVRENRTYGNPMNSYKRWECKSVKEQK